MGYDKIPTTSSSFVKSIHSYNSIEDEAYFTVDPRAAQALFKGLKDDLHDITGVFEPMCGGGHLAEAIKEENIAVFAQDLNNYGYFQQEIKEDFLDCQYLPLGFNSIFSNPPYSHPLAETIIRHAIDITTSGGIIAMLMPHGWDSAGGRHSFFDDESCFYKRIILPCRLWWFKPDLEANPPQKDHIWYVWKKGHSGGSRNIYLKKDDFKNGQQAKDQIHLPAEFCHS